MKVTVVVKICLHTPYTFSEIIYCSYINKYQANQEEFAIQWATISVDFSLNIVRANIFNIILDANITGNDT